MPPFDLHGMPHPGHAPVMREPWFDPMSAPPKSFNHHHYHHPYPPDHLHGHHSMGARDYRGGGGRGVGGLYFNEQHNMVDYHTSVLNVDFANSNGPLSNSQLSSSDGLTSGENFLLPHNHQIHPGSEFAARAQSVPCR